jgi:UDP-N-acetylglucosamine 2-epimerase (non-hydrolysing)
MSICCVVGARPNFMKMAPVVDALREEGLPPLLVHTGQHYDQALSQVFFDQLGMPHPDVHLEVGSDSHARQTARLLTTFEEVCLEHQPELVVVAGDVNSTVAAALVATKLHIPVAHVEAGLRSFDRAMPEEINRVLTDHMSTLLLVSEESGLVNLRREGIEGSTGRDAIEVALVGNCMVDSLVTHRAAAVAAAPWREHGLEPGGYALVTLHRPANVDTREALGPILDTLAQVAAETGWPVLFPLHPRTAARLESWGLELPTGIRGCPPLPYLSFLGLMARAAAVLTDSGGIQEETTALGVPCLTLRENTERPSTVELGSNRLVGSDRELILRSVTEIKTGQWRSGTVPPLWDGAAGKRVARRIGDWLDRQAGES